MPNGCCMRHSDCVCHGPDCHSYWPCGCAKKRKANGQVIAHTHRYSEPRYHEPRQERYTLPADEDGALGMDPDD